MAGLVAGLSGPVPYGCVDLPQWFGGGSQLTMDRHEARRLADRFNLQNGQSKRIDCPTCGGRYTFSLTRQAGAVLYHCFRASCGERGSVGLPRTAEEIAAALQGREADRGRAVFEVPPYWTSVSGNEEALRYMESTNTVHAFEAGLVDLVVDPKANRIVFLNRHEGRIVDAVGRALRKGASPKWYRYGDHPAPFVVQPKSRTSTCVVVEDAASACAVAAAGVAGVALMGTNLKDSTKRLLKGRWSHYIVALDKDASVKSLSLQRDLQSLGRSSIMLLDKDLKYLSAAEIQSAVAQLNGGLINEAASHDNYHT